jgi:3-phenylpropionate/cinnamic acid dioxygenase small subunit
MTDIADLEARLAVLEAERGVLQTLYRYGHSIDYGDEESWVDCFTEDGVFEIRSRVEHQPSRLISGREALRTFISRHTRAPELWHKHMLVEPQIEIESGDAARCSSYLFVLMEHEERPVVRVFGRYLDRLEKGSDGRWRFKHRLAEIEGFQPGLPPFVDGRPGLDR